MVVSCDGGESPLFLRRDVMRHKTPSGAVRGVPYSVAPPLGSQAQLKSLTATGTAFAPVAESPATPPSVRIYVAALSIVAVAACGLLVQFGPVLSGRQLALAFALGAFTLAAELLNYRKPAGGNGSVAHIPLLALAIVAPSWPAMLIAALLILIFAASQRRPAVRALFNAAQVSLATGTAIAVYLVCGGRALELLPRDAIMGARLAGTVLLADAAFVLVNTTAVSAVLSLTTGKPFRRVWSSSTLGTLAYYFFCAPFAGGLLV